MKNLLKQLTFLFVIALLGQQSVLAQVTATGKTFWNFESGQVRPLAISPDGSRLFAVNTPDNHLEIFTITASGLEFETSVAVGLEPVAVAARSNTEVWVLNHMSDSVSIIDLSASPARVVRTLLVGDEPRDIVFAGTPVQPGDPFPRAFITTAHRGQVHGVDVSGEKYGDFFSPDAGRADVWVFDANSLGDAQTGTPETVITFFGDTPRALAVTPSGDKVYTAIFHSGNRTTALPESGAIDFANFGVAPSIAEIVKFNGSNWVNNDNNSRSGVNLQLPDFDVFEINATAATPVEIRSFSGVGTILFNMAINPVSGKVYVSNTEANNLVPHEPALNGNIHQSRITVIDGLGAVVPRHLNKHINYNQFPSPAGTADDSLATPTAMVIANDGTLYVAAFGSSKVGAFDVATLEDNSFTPDSANHITVSGGGPSGIVLDEARNRLYVMTRFDNGVSIINRSTGLEADHLLLHNPEPASVTAGRSFLYDANVSSSNGEASCSSCHVFGRMDDLAWDLGDPAGSAVINPNPYELASFGTPQFHPLKGPMVTQSFRGMDNHGPMHWRGDRSGALSGSFFNDEDAAFKQFNPAFVGLLGRTSQLSAAQIQAFTDFTLQLVYPPNPIRNLDNSDSSEEAIGRALFMADASDQGVKTCNDCHTLNESDGFFGTSGFSSFEAGPQDMKVAHLRNMYQKVGMFGGVATTVNFPGVGSVSTPSAGPNNQPQVRGFGYTHSGVVDTLESFSGISLFAYPGNRSTAIERISKFMLAFPSELTPIVGQQVTLNAANMAQVSARIDLFIQRAQAAYPSPTSLQQRECDLVVKGFVGGAERGAVFNTGTGLFDTDRSSDPALTDAQVRDLVLTGGQLTYTCAPPGSGYRMALDRDMDGLLNYDELVVYGSSPASSDTDGDGLSDNDEVTVHGTNPALADSDIDGLADNVELFTTGTNPTNADTDGDGLLDGAEVTAGSNPNDAAPVVSISTPDAGALFFESESVSFTASAADNEDGNLSSTIQWSSNIDGVLGIGANISVSLSGGSHIVSAAVTDSQSATVISTVSVSSDGLPGDINDDGQVTVSDLLLLQQHLLNESLIVDPYSIHRGDLYPPSGGDDVLDLSDHLQLEQLLVTP